MGDKKIAVITNSERNFKFFLDQVHNSERDNFIKIFKQEHVYANKFAEVISLWDADELFGYQEILFLARQRIE